MSISFNELNAGVIMQISTATYDTLRNSKLLLRLAYAFLFLAAGADKFFDIITYWPKYVSPVLLKLVATPIENFVMGVGIFEVVLGLLFLSPFSRLASYIAFLWLMAIAVNLLSMHAFIDIAARDIVLAIGALVLGKLTSVVTRISRQDLN